MMTPDAIMQQIDRLNQADKEIVYMKVMEGYFSAMMSNPRFMQGAIHRMAGYLKRMQDSGMDVSSILTQMEGAVAQPK